MGADLGRLLEAEQGFAARIDAARHEARALLESARREAEALRTDSAATLAQGKHALAEEENRTLASELARLDAETTARVERLASVSDARVTELADQTLRALLKGSRG